MIEDLPISTGQNTRKGPRMSVSAEVFGKFNIQEEYKPPVHPKDEASIAKLRERMSQNFMFESLNPKDSKAVLDAIIPVKKAKDEFVIKQGEDGDHFYLVESGELACSKLLEKTDAAETFLKNYVPGESFGELALLYNAPRAATIKCNTDCELWQLDRQTFTAIIKTAVQKKREKYDNFLQNVPILKMMEPIERGKLADAFKEEWFEEDQFIIKQGDNKDNSAFYMIIEGECQATRSFQPGQPAVEVRKYEPGDYFGERALLRNEPRAANIIAKS